MRAIVTLDFQSRETRETLSVVITTKNSAKTIGKTLSSITPYIKMGCVNEIIVVDSRSTDETVQISQSHGARIIVEDAPPGKSLRTRWMLRNYASFFHACNLGWKSARGDLVMFIDSDAFVGSDFCPRVNDFFYDASIGILGCHAKAITRNHLSKTIGEMWDYHARFLRRNMSGIGKSSLFSRIYKFFVWGRADMRDLYTSGPCYVARKSSLLAVEGLDLTGDIGVSEKIVRAGWRSKWWVDAPVLHIAKSTFPQLIRERLLWGYMTPLFHDGRATTLLRTLSAAIIAPLGGLVLYHSTRNWRHILVQQVIHTSVLVGAFYGFISCVGWRKLGLAQIEEWIAC